MLDTKWCSKQLDLNDSSFTIQKFEYLLGYLGYVLKKAILTAPCFIATKFEAFNDRGTDYKTSHDFEDIIYVIDNRTTIVEENASDEDEIKEFIQNE